MLQSNQKRTQNLKGKMALEFRFVVLWVHPKSGQEEWKNQIIAMLVIFICTLASDQTDCRKSFDFPTNSAQTG